MISNVTADVTNSVKYNCSGNIDLLSTVEVEGTVDMLQREMESFVDEFADKDVQPTFGGLYRHRDKQINRAHHRYLCNEAERRSKLVYGLRINSIFVGFILQPKGLILHKQYVDQRFVLIFDLNPPPAV